jgi:hypothetical protein
VIRGKVVRGESTPFGTPGRMALENDFRCDTLELGWHNNERGKSCTKADTYRGKVWWSPSLKRLVIRFEDKHGRKDCLVHNGNFAGEERDIDGDGAAEVTQIHGCTLVGVGHGDVQRKDGKMQFGIKQSGSTLAALIESLRVKDLSEADTVIEMNSDGHGFHDVEIQYRWGDGCAPEGQQ